MIRDTPVYSESGLHSALERILNFGTDVSSNIYGMRQLSVASVISIGDNYMKYALQILNLGEEVCVEAMLTHHPNYWNITGYPAVGDLVLVMHQRQYNDVHILMRLQTKQTPILEHPTLKNNDKVPVGPNTP